MALIGSFVVERKHWSIFLINKSLSDLVKFFTTVLRFFPSSLNFFSFIYLNVDCYYIINFLHKIILVGIFFNRVFGRFLFNLLFNIFSGSLNFICRQLLYYQINFLKKYIFGQIFLGEIILVDFFKLLFNMFFRFI